MNSLKSVFQEESEVIFQQLEQSLLLLEESPDDTTLIAEVFRLMHTIKGNSGMFGTTKIVDLVHNLETIYDKIRSQLVQLDSKIIDFTFKAMDHMKNVIADPELENPTNVQTHQLLVDQFDEFLSQTENTEEKISTNPEPTSHKCTYFVQLDPAEHVLKNGTNPILLLEELSQLGRTKVYPYFNARLTSPKYKATSNYAQWNIILVTEAAVAHIQDVFIFIEDEANITITKLFDADLLSNVAFSNKLPEIDFSATPFTLQFLEELIKEIPSENLEAKAATETVSIPENAEASSAPQNDNKAISSIRVSADKLDELMNQVSELVTTQAGLALYAKNNFDPRLEAIADNVEKLSRQLRDLAFGMTLIPIDNLFGRFRRLIRDLSGKLGKSVNFITEGGETELDKSIIETLADPLIHLIRNSLDHGIETPEERLRKGKSEKGTVKLKSYYSGAKVYIQIEDDGKGLDPEKIRTKAIDKGLISPEDNLTEKEIFELIFAPGFSMAKEVTDVSGRGVGMDVVKKNVLDIRGDITIESKLDKGTTFKLGLPLTLSVIDGLLIKIQATHYIIPLADIKKCFEVKTEKLANDFNHLIDLDGEAIPFINLRNEFEVSEDQPAFSSIIVIENEDSKIGISADSIVGEYQAVLKPVGKYYRNQEFVSGATILGDGTIALVLDAHKIIAQKRIKQKLVNA